MMQLKLTHLRPRPMAKLKSPEQSGNLSVRAFGPDLMVEG